MPEVLPVVPLADWLKEPKEPKEGALLFCYENEDQQPIKAALRALPEDVRRITVLIGPEGGFSLPEAAAITEAGGQSVTLGPRILRTETAGLCALTMVMADRGEME